VLERAVNANYRLGQAAHARALARFAKNSDVPESSRRDALAALADWAKPSAKDRVLNQWRPLPDRGANDAKVAIAPEVSDLLRSGQNGVQEMAARLAQKFGLAEAGQPLAELVVNDKAGASGRIAALQALKSLKDDRLPQAARAAMSAKDDRLRSEALKALAGADAVKAISEVIERGSVRERQGGIAALLEMNSPEAKAVLGTLADKLVAGQCPPEIMLDVYEAAKKSGHQDKANAYKATLSDKDPLANYQLSLAGGDLERGRRIFREKVEVQCLRCHKCEIGDSVVGPDLTKIAATLDRKALLEAIVFPNAKIAAGFQNVMLTTKDNQMVAGRLVNEGAGQLTIETVDEQGKPKTATVAADQVKERLSAPSPMPENIREQLSRWELRDLVEYLATRK
jgi:quinoprotein glucose dehydrogenase